MNPGSSANSHAEGTRTQQGFDVIRTNLQNLQNAVDEAERAVRKAEEARDALEERDSLRRRWSNWDSDSDVPEMNFDEADFPDENEEGFDWIAKYRKLDQEVVHCKRQALIAQQAYMHYLEPHVKANAAGPLTALYTAMSKKLPIEIRDMIYSYLDLKDEYASTFGLSKFNPNFHSGDEFELNNLLIEGHEAVKAGTYDTRTLTPGGWLINADFVGQGLAREIAKTFYSANQFSVAVSQLPALLTVDRSQSGLKPYEFIRGRLTVGIKTTMCNGPSEPAWESTENEVAFLDAIYTQLNALPLIPRKANSSIVIWLGTSSPSGDPDMEGTRRFYNIMEAVRAPIYDLIHAGWDITVKHKTTSTGLSQLISTAPYNWFAMGKAEWEEERGSHGPDWLPSKHYVAREECKEDQLRNLLKQRWGYRVPPDPYKRYGIACLGTVP